MPLSLSSKTPSAQEFVPVSDVRDGIVLLRDGGLRALLLVSSVNFALKSEDEQTAILSQFQQFLNTLDFSLQLYVQSRTLDIQPYLTLLRSREPEQTNDLMRVQLREYIGFIEHFAAETEVMTKSFFVVVPYSPSSIRFEAGSGLRSMLQFRAGAGKDEAATTRRFEEDRAQLNQRIVVVEQGLARLGLRSVLLGTNEVVELFHRLFNPGETRPAAPIG
mgnify:FL=1